MIKAKVIADSKMVFNKRLTSMVVTMPRYILAELNTHRMFSKNSASSRAIPFDKMLKSVQENPFIPMAWQVDHKGMQGTKYCDDECIPMMERRWLMGRDAAVNMASHLNYDLDCTKQLCNRLLEPFMWHTVIITASEWTNFFELRCPKYIVKVNNGEEGYATCSSRREAIHISDEDNIKNWDNVEWLQHNEGQADIHMMALAEAMYDAYNESIPKKLSFEQWHIPFGDSIDINDVLPYYNSIKSSSDDLTPDITWKVKMATAMCARVSYTVVGEENKKPNCENDIKLHDRLLASGHWSPFEHCAKVMTEREYYENIKGIIPYGFSDTENIIEDKGQYGWSGNFQGFIQYRQMLNK